MNTPPATAGAERTGRSSVSAVRLGVLAPLTPPGWVEAGRHLLAGLELAVRDVNDVSGIAGRPLQLVVRDTAADPQRAAAAVDELARLGVAALAGEYHSVVARATAERASALGLPYLCSSSVLDALTEQPTQWVARLSPPQSRGWQVYADFLLGAGHRRIAVAVQPSVYWAAGVRRMGGAAGRGRRRVPFLRYLPETLTPLGARVEKVLREQLGDAPSFRFRVLRTG